MENTQKDYFEWPRLLSVILVIIPVTAWILGLITRFKEGKILAGIIRIFFGWIIWILDLIFMILYGRICRILRIQKKTAFEGSFFYKIDGEKKQAKQRSKAKKQCFFACFENLIHAKVVITKSDKNKNLILAKVI